MCQCYKIKRRLVIYPPPNFAPILESKTPSYYLPNIIDSSVETGRSFDNSSYLYDIFFAGETAPERVAVLDTVKQIPNIKRGFFGIDAAPLLAGAALHEAIAAAKMGLNLSRADNIPLYSSARLAQLTGNGCCVLSPRVPQMEILFTENEVCYFDDHKELPSLINDLLKDDNRRRTIARAGWQRAHACYNETRVCQFIIEATLGNSFSENYEWV